MALFDVAGDEQDVLLTRAIICGDCMEEMTFVQKDLYRCPRCRQHYISTRY